MRTKLFVLLTFYQTINSVLAQDIAYYEGTCNEIIDYSFEQENSNETISIVNFELGEGTFVVDFRAWEQIDTLQVVVSGEVIFSVEVGEKAGIIEPFHWTQDSINYDFNPYLLPVETWPPLEWNELRGYARFTFTTQANCSMQVVARSNIENNTFWDMYIHCCETCTTTNPYEVSRDTLLCINDELLGTKLVNDTIMFDTFVKPNGCLIITDYTVEVNSSETILNEVTCDQSFHNTVLIDTLSNFRGCDSIVSKIQIYPEDLLDLGLEVYPECNQNTEILISSENGEISTTLEILWSTDETDPSIFVPVANQYSVIIVEPSGCSVHLSESVDVWSSSELDLGDDIEITAGLEVSVSSPSTSTDLQDKIRLEPFHIDYENWFPSQDQLVIANLENNLGCMSTDSIFIKVNDRLGVFVPNVFSPNEDGTNEYWTLFTDADIQSYTYEIYNRWGELVYSHHADEPNKEFIAWNGEFKSHDLQLGPFVYQLKIVYKDGFETSFNGDITIMK